MFVALWSTSEKIRPVASVLSPRSISRRAWKLYRQRRCTSSLEGLLIMTGKSSWAWAYGADISSGEDTVVMAARGCNRALVRHKYKLSTYKEERHGMQ